MPHPPILETASQTWADEKACATSAGVLAIALMGQLNRAGQARMVLTLDGELGAGKTTFTRHLLQALGVTGRVKSPTYAVMESYTVRGPQGTPWPVSHFDFYRFRDPQEWEDAGFRDVFATPGLQVCEWPDRAEGLMPVPDLEVVLQMVPAATGAQHEQPQRRASVSARTPLGQAVLAAWQAGGGSL